MPQQLSRCTFCLVALLYMIDWCCCYCWLQCISQHSSTVVNIKISLSKIRTMSNFHVSPAPACAHIFKYWFVFLAVTFSESLGQGIAEIMSFLSVLTACCLWMQQSAFYDFATVIISWNVKQISKQIRTALLHLSAHRVDGERSFFLLSKAGKDNLTTIYFS